MTMNKKQITRKLTQLGGAWAVGADKYIDPSDPFGSRPSYHIHPDVSYPHQSAIKRFYNMAEVATYLAAREQANQAADTGEAYRIMEDFEASLPPRHD